MLVELQDKLANSRKRDLRWRSSDLQVLERFFERFLQKECRQEAINKCHPIYPFKWRIIHAGGGDDSDGEGQNLDAAIRHFQRPFFTLHRHARIGGKADVYRSSMRKLPSDAEAHESILF